MAEYEFRQGENDRVSLVRIQPRNEISVRLRETVQNRKTALRQRRQWRASLFQNSMTEEVQRG